MDVVYMPEGVPWKKRAKSIDWLAKAGIRNIALDLRQYCSEYELENREKIMKIAAEQTESEFVSLDPERLGKLADKLIAQSWELGMKNTIATVPSLPWTTERNDLEWLVRELTRQSICACKRAGCRYMILNPLVKALDQPVEWEKNIDFYLSFLTDLSDAGEYILVPNHYRQHNGHFVRGSFSDPYALGRFVDELNSRVQNERFGICADMGICNLLGQNPHEFMKLLGNRVKAVVIRENYGVADNALLPFSVCDNAAGQVDWLGVIRGLREIDFDGQLIFDFRGTVAAYSHLLRADLDVFIKKFIDYWVWQISMERVMKKYSMRVLFGAGNMCRNYMNCYGKMYRPLFTCDNNPAVWGSIFEGLEVKNPEELRALPTTCAIFICNVYYEEIEQQIRSMGLQNPIERFNDEYLPSFCFDSLEK